MKKLIGPNIISFPQVRPCPVPSRCEVCEQPVLTGSTCRNCAVGLVDLALSTGSEDSFDVVCELDDQTAGKGVGLDYGHYRICQLPDGNPWELGRGAMGITYKAVDTHLGNPVALKIIAPSRLASTYARERFLLEARTAARLRHPNIASIYHLGTDEGTCFYAMEHIDGETLEEHILRAGALAPELALRIALQCVRALCLAHGQRFIHRDLKPSNIMLAGALHDGADDAPLIKLIDFGLVKTLIEDDHQMAGASQLYFAGTPYYASPEQLAGKSVDARADIFSLGMCLWFMLLGKHPTSHSAAAGGKECPRSWTSLMAELSGKIPAEIFSLVESIIAPDPAARPQNTLALASDIERCLRLISSRTTKLRRFVTLLSILCGILFLTGTTYIAYSCGIPRVQSLSPIPTDVQVLYAKAEEARLRRTKPEIQRAIDLYTAAIAKFPVFADAHAGLAIAYFNSVSRFGGAANQLDLADDHAQRAIALDPRSAKGYHAHSAILTFQGRPWDALNELHHALEIDPGYAPAVRDFGLLWNYVGQSQRGLAWAKASTKIEPSNLFGWIATAEAATDLCADEQARECYEHALKINPASVPGLCGLMHLHILHGEFDQAHRDYVPASSVDPESAFPLNLKAQNALFRGDYAEAEILYRKLVARDRSGLVTYYSGISYLSALGFLRCRAGDLVEGKTLLDEAAMLHVKDSEGPQAMYDLAAIRSIQGSADEALSLLHQAILSGWIDYRATRSDPRFELLRANPEFDQLLTGVKERVEQMRHEAELLCLKPLRIEDFPVQPPR